jgi:hypothetical protein
LVELYNGEINMECDKCNKKISIEDKIIINVKKLTILKNEEYVNCEKIYLHEESLKLIEKKLNDLKKKVNDYISINENIFLTYNNIKDD